MQESKKIVLFSDLHLEDSLKCEYRWDVFDTMKKSLIEHQPEYLFILGDITHYKDKHRNAFLLRIIQNIIELAEVGKENNPKFRLYIIKGNHDYFDEAFLSIFNLFNKYTTSVLCSKACFSLKINFIDKSAVIKLFDTYKALLFPHTNDFSDRKLLSKNYEVVFTHLLFNNALGLNNIKLESNISTSLFKTPLIVSGDVHNTQSILQQNTKLVYVGAPHNINYGDFTIGGLLMEYNEDNEVLFTDIVHRTTEKLRISLDGSNKSKLCNTLQNLEFLPTNMYKFIVFGHDPSDMWEISRIISEWAVSSKLLDYQIFFTKEEEKAIAHKETLEGEYCAIKVLKEYIECKNINGTTETVAVDILKNVLEED